ncbi:MULTISPECIES: LysR family transcriptional regulator [Pseudomonas]|uniref:LysR family transcriptional regulator n=1 Tax=Pseudomonas TaxID=286 RepID=UPI00257D665E|nr:MULTISPECIES: LysR family transcriptional regulator [Pseudomonas]
MKVHSEELQHFVAVVESGSLSAAAQLLGLTPSALSRSLSRLEQKLSTTLLNRTTRRMELTEEGRFYLENAKAILQQMEALEERLSLRRQTPSGRLRIDAASPFMLHAVVPHIGEFRRLYPDIQLELSSNDLNIDLIEQRTDVAIRIGTLSDSTLHARPLGAAPLNLVASPDYLARHPAPTCAEALREHSLIGFTQPESLNLWPLLHDGGNQWPITPTIAASSGETLRHLALAGQGIACLASFMSDADIAAGRLIRLLPEHMSDYRQPIHAVYYRNSQLALRIQCFLDFIQERLQPIRRPR